MGRIDGVSRLRFTRQRRVTDDKAARVPLPPPLPPLDETFVAQLDARVDSHYDGCLCDDCFDLRIMRGDGT